MLPEELGQASNGIEFIREGATAANISTDSAVHEGRRDCHQLVQGSESNEFITSKSWMMAMGCSLLAVTVAVIWFLVRPYVVEQFSWGHDPLWKPLPDHHKMLQRVVFGSCIDQRYPHPFWDVMASFKPDILLLLGDNVYGDCSNAECTELSEAYSNLSAHPSFNGFRREFPVLATWDDHDFGLNDAGGDLPWKAKAKELFLDFFNIPASDPRREISRGLYTGYMFGPVGHRVQIIVLDTRWYRSSLRHHEAGDVGNGRYVPDSNPEKSMLGAEQWAWLEDQLLQPADLRLLFSSVQVIASQHGWEKWGNFPHERLRLLNLLRIANPAPLVLSGDRHVGGLYYYNESSGPVLWELTSSSFTHTSPVPPTTGDIEEPLRVGNLVHENNFGLITIDWHELVAKMELRRAFGHRSGEVIGEGLEEYPLSVNRV